MLNTILKKIIRTAGSGGRLAFAVFGLAIAMLLILAAVQLQANYNTLLYSKSNQDSIANFLVISKPVTDETINQSNLTAEEINKLKQQPFIEEIGQLTPSSYQVRISTLSDRFPFSTEAFFESVPEQFIDVNDKNWKWTEQSDFVPIILPNSFLDMYNNGFAVAQDMPKLTPQLLTNIGFKLTVYSYSGQKDYIGRVVGFSNRITSILVPQSFNELANKNFGNTKSSPSRIVIKTNDPGDPKLTDYLKENNLVTDADKTRFSRYRKTVNIVANISWGTGAAMLLFALLVFTLFIQLTIASARNEINLLITLGTSPKQLQRFLIKRFFPVNVVITIIVLIILSAVQFLIKQYLDKQNIFLMPYLSWITGAAAVLILLVLWIVNYSTIRKYINK